MFKVLVHYFKAAFLFAVFFSASSTFCQSAGQTFTVTKNLNWTESSSKVTEKSSAASPLILDGFGFMPKQGILLPYYNEKFKVAEGMLSVSLQNAVYEEVKDINAVAYFSGLPELINPVIQSYYESGVHYAAVHFTPLRYSKGKLEKLSSFTLQISSKPAPVTLMKKKATWAANSVLGSGNWYRFAVSLAGIYKLDYAALQAAGVPVDNIDPRTLKLYGHGGLLPAVNSAPRDGDIPELAIQVIGEGDGKFDKSDYILFYAKGPHGWAYDENQKMFRHQYNYYSDVLNYFLTYGGGNGKRVQSYIDGNSLSESTVVNSYDDYLFHEDHRFNFARSGRDWWGDEFSEFQNTLSFQFKFPGYVPNDTLKMYTLFGAHAGEATRFILSVNGTKTNEAYMFASGLDYDNDYLRETEAKTSYLLNSEIVNLFFQYNKNWNSSKGYINYYDLNVRRSLAMHSAQLPFRDSRSLGAIARFDFQDNGGFLQIWDVTDHRNVHVQQTYQSGSNRSFKVLADKIHEYIAFNGTEYYVPRFEGTVANQNLHAQPGVDYIIITNPLFRTEADRLADYHRAKNGLSVFVVEPQKIYNEFSSGTQDIVAIRDFLKMLWDKSGSGKPKYVLMFGKASYDFKGMIKNNTNFVPSYQSLDAYSYAGSYCTDDYFVLMDDNEGDYEGSFMNQSLDMSIARFPVSTADEARAVVNKIINYHSAPAMRDWRNLLTFVADDLDEGWITGHLEDAEYQVKLIDTVYREYNIDKIYCDAYRKISEGPGKKFPEVTAAINQAVEKGSLIINYSGHGGEAGWAHERILEVPHIVSWKNSKNLPLFVTATCEFSRFDDPARLSAGELAFTNPNGGAIAMFTTTRVVYQFNNRVLNSKLYENNVFELVNGKYPTLGEVYQKMKNGFLDFNSRNFTFFGDPALTLAYPEFDAVTLSVNGKPASQKDTLKALSKVTITGELRDKNGNKLSSFNGTIYPTVFDKPKLLKGIKNEPWSRDYTFYLQKSIIYKGEASVTNGSFSFSFMVPKDIDYQFGNGKISYYAQNGSNDANGYYENFIIGGSVDSVKEDKTPPRVDLFMNDDKWVSGGITGSAPLLLSRVFDENGINTVGNGIGHEIIATLDANTPDKKIFVLNDYYKAKKDSYTEGEISFPLSGLKEGRHTLSIKVWDVFNNSAEAHTEFIVVNDAKTTLAHVLNYPNPFTTHTAFHFDHNKPGQDLKVQVQILSTTGKLVKTINQDIAAANSHIDAITWDGLDEFGDRIARGVYLYKLTVRAQDGSSAEKTEKLVILN